jgi:hypothetical protein
VFPVPLTPWLALPACIACLAVFPVPLTPWLALPVDSLAGIARSVPREVLEGSNELRLMLCREKHTGNRVGTSVISACGASSPPAPWPPP